MGSVLIHAQGGGKSAAADERRTGQFKESLYRAVLSVFSVKYGKNGIYGDTIGLLSAEKQQRMITAIRRVCGGNTAFILMPGVVGYLSGLAEVGEPVSFAGNTDGKRAVTFSVHVRDHRVSRFQRDAVL